MKYFLACSYFLSAVAALGQVDHTMWQSDTQHSGANLNETILTPGNVGSPGNFGLLFTQTIDGQSYGQPLYVSAATLGKFADGSTHNVVYVATQHDSIFAFDADTNGTAQTGVPLWQVSLLQPGQTPVPQGVVGSGDITVELGITATPVIDPVGGTLYTVSKVAIPSNGTYQQYLYALDLKTGATKFGSPVLINPTFAGSAQDGVNGVVPFSALHEHGRSALLLYNGVLYITYASHSDTQPYHGEILGYDPTSLQLVKTFITSPNGNEAGIWGSGASPAIDSEGNMYVGTGNGNFDQNPSSYTTNTDWAISVLKLPTNTTGPITLPFSNTLNWFTPNNWSTLDNGNLDLNGGLLLLPDQTGGNHTHIMVLGGKGAVLYVLDRDNLGGSIPRTMPFRKLRSRKGIGCSPRRPTSTAICTIRRPAAHWSSEQSDMNLLPAITSQPRLSPRPTYITTRATVFSSRPTATTMASFGLSAEAVWMPTMPPASRDRLFIRHNPPSPPAISPPKTQK